METKYNNIEITEKTNKNRTQWNDPIINVNAINETKDTENFQIMNMQYKIKKVKNRKKRGENYKNIPLFETLTNDPINEIPAVINAGTSVEEFDPVPVNHKNTENSGNATDNNIKKDYVNDFYQFCSNMYNKTIGSVLSPIVEPYWGARDPNDYEDNVKPIDCDNKTYGAKLADFIERMYQYILALNRYIANTILVSFTEPASKSQIKKGDVDLLAHYIALCEAVLFSSCATFNWYYLIYYMQTKMNKPIVPLDISIDALFKYEKNNLGIFKIITFFMFFFKYAVLILEIINRFLMNMLHKFTPTSMTGSTGFIIMFFCIFYISIHFVEQIKNTLIGVLTLKPNAFYLSLTAIIILSFLIIDGALLLIELKPVKHIIVMIVYGFIFLIKLILAAIIAVPVGLMLCLFYFVIYSLFGIFLYKHADANQNVTIFSLREKIIEISNANSNRMFQSLGLNNGDNTMNHFITMCLLYFSAFGDMVFAKLFVLTYIIILTYAVFDTFNNISKIHSVIPDLITKETSVTSNDNKGAAVESFIEGATNGANRSVSGGERLNSGDVQRISKEFAGIKNGLNKINIKDIFSNTENKIKPDVSYLTYTETGSYVHLSTLTSVVTLILVLIIYGWWIFGDYEHLYKLLLEKIDFFNKTKQNANDLVTTRNEPRGSIMSAVKNKFYAAKGDNTQPDGSIMSAVKNKINATQDSLNELKGPATDYLYKTNNLVIPDPQQLLQNATSGTSALAGMIPKDTSALTAGLSSMFGK